jgi:hypothetical protein
MSYTESQTAVVDRKIEVLTSKERSSARASVEGKLVQLALVEIKEPVASEALDASLAISAEQSEFEREIVRQVQNVRVPEKRVGHRFYEAKVQAEEGVLRQVRLIGTSSPLMAGLSVDQRRLLTHGWQRDWSRAVVPWGTLDHNKLWRLGGGSSV